jgi:transcription termination factor Rho
MSVLDRRSLEASPLADLHAIASELSIDGFRRLRREELIEAILSRQGGDGDAQQEPPAPRRRRSRRAPRDAEPSVPSAEASAAPAADDEQERAEPEAREETVEGVVELLPNGSGFLRVQPPEPSDDDVYISAAQVKRCELVSGDQIAGPKRPPRRSERFASLHRIDTINGTPATDVAGRARFDELPATFPDQRLHLGSDDPTLKAIEWLTPLGRGSRVTIAGPPRSGKSEALRRITGALAGQEGLQLFVALAGVRPEEISEWSEASPAPTAAVSFAASTDAQDSAVELVIDQARRLVSRGADVVVCIDTLDGLHPHAARKALAAARNLRDAGSLTVIATASEALGGETTVIALDARLAGSGRFPALDLLASGTLRPELLVGEAGAEAIAQARSEAFEK